MGEFKFGLGCFLVRLSFFVKKKKKSYSYLFSVFSINHIVVFFDVIYSTNYIVFLIN